MGRKRDDRIHTIRSQACHLPSTTTGGSRGARLTTRKAMRPHMNSEISHHEISVKDFHVQEVVRSAESELVALLQQRAELMKRIGSIKQTLVGLANMFGDSVLNEQLLELLDRGTAR